MTQSTPRSNDEILGAEFDGLSRPTSKAGRLQRLALLALYRHRRRAELPTSCRFLFYELEQDGAVVKNRGINPRTGKPYARRSDTDLSEAVTVLREVGIVPWTWLVDDTRTVHNWSSSYVTVEDQVRAYVQHARINPWDGPAPLLLTESRTVGGVFERGIAREFRVPVAATNGQVGGFLRTDVAPLLEGNDRQVLYVGDFDLQGDQIEANTRKVLAEITDRSDLLLDIESGGSWERIALTSEQTHNLLVRGVEPIEKRDNRYRPPRRVQAFEVEALGQTTVVGLIRDRLTDLLPEPLEDVQEREQDERDEVLDLLGGA